MSYESFKTSRDIDVAVAGVANTDDDTFSSGVSLSWASPVAGIPAQVMLRVAQTINPDDLGVPMGVPDELTVASDQALSEAASLLAITCQARHNVYSPQPYIFLEPETSDERSVLASTEHIALSSPRPGRSVQGPGGDQRGILHQLISDRPTGVALLGAALGAGHGVAELHELIRVFENGFAASGAKLADLLTEFLRSYPSWKPGYTRGEVRGWIMDLRHPATHADLQRSLSVLLDPDVEPYLPRIEQAAYDVLLNKSRWNCRDTSRRQRWSFSAMILRDGSSIGSPTHAALRLNDGWDHQNAFRLDERYKVSLESVPKEWWPINWEDREFESGVMASQDLPPSEFR